MTNNYIRATVFGEPDETGRIPTLETEVFLFDDRVSWGRADAVDAAFDWVAERGQEKVCTSLVTAYNDHDPIPERATCTP